MLLSLFLLPIDQPSVVQQRSTDVQAADLQLLPEGLLDVSLQEAIPWRADLPLEAQRREAGLKTAEELERFSQKPTVTPDTFGPKASQSQQLPDSSVRFW